MAGFPVGEGFLEGGLGSAVVGRDAILASQIPVELSIQFLKPAAQFLFVFCGYLSTVLRLLGTKLLETLLNCQGIFVDAFDFLRPEAKRSLL